MGVTPGGGAAYRDTLSASSLSLSVVLAIAPHSSFLGEAAYAFSDLGKHVAQLRKFYAPFADMSPGMGEMEACFSLSTRLRNK